jgi:hypothetical protein
LRRKAGEGSQPCLSAVFEVDRQDPLAHGLRGVLDEALRDAFEGPIRETVRELDPARRVLEARRACASDAEDQAREQAACRAPDDEPHSFV